MDTEEACERWKKHPGGSECGRLSSRTSTQDWRAQAKRVSVRLPGYAVKEAGLLLDSDWSLDVSKYLLPELHILCSILLPSLTGVMLARRMVGLYSMKQPWIMSEANQESSGEGWRSANLITGKTQAAVASCFGCPKERTNHCVRG